MKIKLGEQVKDKLTGFKGTTVARAEYLYGCVWVCVVPKDLVEGKPLEDTWFDEQRLKVIIAKKVKLDNTIKDTFRYRGGPIPSMPRMSRPKPHTKT